MRGLANLKKLVSATLYNTEVLQQWIEPAAVLGDDVAGIAVF